MKNFPFIIQQVIAIIFPLNHEIEVFFNIQN